MKNKRRVCRFSDNEEVFFGPGKIDDWCVYKQGTNGRYSALLDSEYFQDLLDLSRKYGTDAVYNDFRTVYGMIDKYQDGARDEHIRGIMDMTKKYDGDWLRACKLFVILYSAMISEENRVFGGRFRTKVGKQIKAVGVANMLVDNMDVMVAAHRTRKMPWNEIRDEAVKYGFMR